MPNLVIEPNVVGGHSPCTDGRTSLFLLSKSLPNVPQFGLSHGVLPPKEWVGKKILMADFSYPEPILRKLIQDNEHVEIWDHHLGAMEVCEKLAREFPTKFTYIFDNTRSGAGIVADQLGLRNSFIDAVEAIDLWRGTEDQKAIVEYLRCYESPDNFELHQEMWETIGTQQLSHYLSKGKAMLDFKMQQVQLATKFAEEIEIAGHKVFATNVPYFLCSETANELIRDRKFGVTYYFDGPSKKWKLSFRSNKDFDTIPIAKSFGGNGHPSASGATVKELPWLQNPLETLMQH